MLPAIQKIISQKKISFFDDEELVVLNGDVKQLKINYEDTQDKLIDAGDYGIVYLDKHGDVIKMITGFHGSFFQTNYFTIYNTKGKRVKSIGYLRRSDPTSIPQNLFRAPSKKIDTGKIIMEVYNYDNHNHIIKSTLDPTKVSAEMKTYKYDDNDMIECDNYSSSKFPTDLTTYRYDEQHNLIQSDNYVGKRPIEEIKYKYKSFDSHNNWTEAIKRSNSIYQTKSLIISREISYY